MSSRCSPSLRVAESRTQYPSAAPQDFGISPKDRTDARKSSIAAAQYIASLYRRFEDVEWTVAAYNAGGHNLKRATGFRRGLDIEAARVMPEAYALAKAVSWLIRKYGNICE